MVLSAVALRAEVAGIAAFVPYTCFLWLFDKDDQ